MSNLSPSASSIPVQVSLASDVQGLDALKSAAGRDPKGAAKAAAQQFEALFMQELVKSMRKATLDSELLDNEGSKMGQDMLDQQLAQQMTGLPGGLGDAIYRQLAQRIDPTAQPVGPAVGGLTTRPWAQRPAASTPVGGAAPLQSAGRASGGEPVKAPKTQTEFVQQHLRSARAAELATGIPSAFMVAQAGHESGWGRHEIKHPDGSTSHNLFGIKAGGSWKGDVAVVTTTEYINGVARKMKQAFRAYSSYEESFKDYARLISKSPRYADALSQAQRGSIEGFAQGLQRGGYGTDPAYAKKLTSTINATLRLQRWMGS